MRALQGELREESGLQVVPRSDAPAALRRLGRYQLVARLAVGGMAEVYLARHGELAGFRTLVVIKRVLPELAGNPRFISMFLDEARIASRLDHPNVVRIVEVGRDDGGEYFLAMELVRGRPLSSVLRRAIARRETLSPAVAAWIIAQAAAGLHHAHGLTDAAGQPLGLVHRDVSPQNTLVSFEGAVKVIDFGIAAALGGLADGSGPKGKVSYMAPERACGQPVDFRADIFALGVVLWESLCCRRLFARGDDTATMRAIREEPLPRPSALVKVPPALERIVMRALSRDPRGRFATAGEMSQALERFAFASAGSSTGDVGLLMRRYFAEDRERWSRTTQAALEMDDPADSSEVRSIKLTHSGLPIAMHLATETPTPEPLPPLWRWTVPAVETALLVLVAVLTAVFVSHARHGGARQEVPQVVVAPAPVAPPAAVVPAPPPVSPPPSAPEWRPAPRRHTREPARPGSGVEALPEHRPNPFL